MGGLGPWAPWAPKSGPVESPSMELNAKLSFTSTYQNRSVLKHVRSLNRFIYCFCIITIRISGIIIIIIINCRQQLFAKYIVAMSC